MHREEVENMKRQRTEATSVKDTIIAVFAKLNITFSETETAIVGKGGNGILAEAEAILRSKGVLTIGRCQSYTSGGTLLAIK